MNYASICCQVGILLLSGLKLSFTGVEEIIFFDLVHFRWHVYWSRKWHLHFLRAENIRNLDNRYQTTH